MRKAAHCFGILIPVLLMGCFLASKDARADVNMIASHSGGATVTYRPDSLRADSLMMNNKIYTVFTCDRHTARCAPGAPLLPSRVVLIAVPKGSAPSIEITALSQGIRKGLTVAPCPTLVDDGNGFTREEYRENPLDYAFSGFRPSGFALLGGRHAFDTYDAWEIHLSPVIFDAHASTAAVLDSLSLNITWSGQLGPAENPGRVPEDILNRDALISRGRTRAPRISIDSSSPFASGDWYRIAVIDSGMYAITGAELSRAGFQAGSVRPEHIRLYYGGGKILDTEPHQITVDDFREIAVKIRDINGDGWFGTDDSVIFYGESLSRVIPLPDTMAVAFQNHPYSNMNIYWLTVSGTGAPLRMRTVSAAPAAELPARTSFREIIHFERENTLEYADSGINWYWDGIKGSSSKYFSFRAPGSVSGDSVQVRVQFLNPTIDKNGTPIAHSHTVDVSIDEIGPYSLSIPGVKKGFIQTSLAGVLAEGNHLLRVSRTSGTPDGTIYLDWFEIEYDRSLEYVQSGLEVFFRGNGEPRNYVISGVTRSTLEIFDTTDPYQAVEYSGMSFDSAGRTLSFRAEPPDKRYSRFVFCEPGSYRKAASVTRKNRSDLRNPRNGADYVVISPRVFLDESKKLAEWRSHDSATDPLQAMAVDIADVYDEFAWGVYDPTAIRDYLKYLNEDCEPSLRYCCIMGDTTFKYKNISPSQTSKNWIPTHTYESVSTDDFFTWFDTTHKPAVSIGRFCVNTLEEAKTTVAKTIDYEKNPERGLWRNRVLLIADDELNSNGVGQEKDFTEYIEEYDVQNYIPRSLERIKLLMIEYPLLNFRKPAATEALLAAFNDGCLMSHFIGHGNKDLLAHEHVLVGSRDIERFNNGGRQSVFFIASCSVGSYDRIDYSSLAEILHLRAAGGCVGVIAASRETFNYSNKQVSHEYYLNLFDQKINPENRIGIALRNSKRVNFDSDIHSNFANRYVIFGDPALRLAFPRYSFATAPMDSLLRLKKVDIDGRVQGLTGSAPFTGTLHVTARGPIIHKRYVVNAGWYVDYTVPGNIFYRGEIPINGNEFFASLVVPKDVVSDTRESRIFLFGDGAGKDASSLIDNLGIGGIDPNAPPDSEGPEIKLSFDGKTFEDGDYVKRMPTLSAVLSDSSGINMYGNRGHNITVTLDRSEVFILTDRLKFVGGHSTASLQFQLPQLSPGEHILELSAYDSHNNVTKKEVKLNVVGSETGEIAIRDLLNYPNPMRRDGTTFTFSLTDDAGSADIKIYSQAGRLVDTIRFNVEYGFNHVFWKPSSEIANGVYFYKLTVHSLNGRKSTGIEKLFVMR